MYTPKIGDSGIFILDTPFNISITPQVIYTIRSIRTMNDILASGALVYERYYQPMGINKDTYLIHAANNDCIIGLQAGTGEWVYVPQAYIKEPPRTTGVKYSSIVIGVGLGAIPDSLNIEHLQTAIGDLVYESLGVTPKIRAVLVSQPAFIAHEKHERLEQARQAKIKRSDTDFSKVKKLEKENDELRAKLTALEDYIRKTI